MFIQAAFAIVFSRTAPADVCDFNQKKTLPSILQWKIFFHFDSFSQLTGFWPVRLVLFNTTEVSTFWGTELQRFPWRNVRGRQIKCASKCLVRKRRYKTIYVHVHLYGSKTWMAIKWEAHLVWSMWVNVCIQWDRRFTRGDFSVWTMLSAAPSM